jgi:hypothetical protein
MSWSGEPALNWRQRALRGDETSLQRDLRTSVERLLPGGMDVKMGAIVNLEDYEQPLTASFDVKGAIGSPTGKRLLVPGDIFEANGHALFPHEKRETAVFFDYPSFVQDAVRITFPSSFSLESIPTSEKVPFDKFAVYNYSAEATPTAFTVRRDFALGNIFFKVEEYPALRSFYNKLQSKDQESAVLKAAVQSAPGN